MSTRCHGRECAALDALESVARVACSRRERLLVVYRRHLPHHDLEDCYSQATLELLVRVKRGRRFHSDQHVAHALDQRMSARVQDRRRALQGRSPTNAVLASALAIDQVSLEVVDSRADVQRLVGLRQDVRRVAQLWGRLSCEQRLVLASQALTQADCRRFCERHGWSHEKYRKVAQRARARLRRLMEGETE